MLFHCDAELALKSSVKGGSTVAGPKGIAAENSEGESEDDSTDLDDEEEDDIDVRGPSFSLLLL